MSYGSGNDRSSSYQDQNVAWGSLGKARERKHAKSPQYIGSLNIDRDLRKGEKIWLAAWVKVGQDGDKYFSIQGSEAQRKERTAPAPAPSRQSDIDSDLPF